MESPKLCRLLNAITGLSAPGCLEALDAVQTRATQIKSAVLEEQIAESVKACPHCGHTALKKAGSKGGRRRFRCGNCRRSFNAFTGTPFARLRKFEKRVDYAGAMLQSMTLSIRKAASRLRINPKTAFRWRHRLLDGVRNLQPGILRGLVEADETYFRQSFKGSRHLPPGRKAKKRGMPAEKRGLSKEQIPVLVARDRSSGETLAQVVESRFEVHIKPALLLHVGTQKLQGAHFQCEMLCPEIILTLLTISIVAKGTERSIGDNQSARDVGQTIFISLARKVAKSPMSDFTDAFSSASM